MAARPSKLARMLDALEKLYGVAPKVRPPKDALGLVLWENVAYLVDDGRRRECFRALERVIGLDAARIREARPEVLREVAALGGMHPERRATKLADIAELVCEEFGGDLDSVLALAPAAARRALKKFPGIGAPGAEKILLLTGTEPVMALESNGLRVLLRLGIGLESKDYAKSYKSAQAAVEPLIPRTCAARTRAFHLLRAHGQTLCKNSAPDCDACPLAPDCAFAAREA